MSRLHAITPFTLLDYPGETACIVWMGGCNMRCVFCHNPDIVKSKGGKDDAELFSFLETRKGKLTAVVFSGGEPTLDEALPETIARVKAMGFKVKIDTNGSRPEVLRELLSSSSLRGAERRSNPSPDGCAGTGGAEGEMDWRVGAYAPPRNDGKGRSLIDYVAMDYKSSPEKAEMITGTAKHWAAFQESLQLLIDAAKNGFGFEVRTTFYADLMDEDDLNFIINDLDARGYQGTYYIQNIASVGEKTIGNIAKPERVLDRARLNPPRGFKLGFRNF